MHFATLDEHSSLVHHRFDSFIRLGRTTQSGTSTDSKIDHGPPSSLVPKGRTSINNSSVQREEKENRKRDRMYVRYLVEFRDLCVSVIDLN